MTCNIPKPILPYDYNALEGTISDKIMHDHYDNRHMGYFNKFNELNENKYNTVEEAVKSSTSLLYNNAAQLWNHAFFWRCMLPTSLQSKGIMAYSKLHELILKSFKSIDKFKEAFLEKSNNHEGEGWTWVLYDKDKDILTLDETKDYGCIVPHDSIVPIMNCDLWKHAYYLDYEDDRKGYLNKWWNIINWEFVAKNLESSYVYAEEQSFTYTTQM